MMLAMAISLCKLEAIQLINANSNAKDAKVLTKTIVLLASIVNI